MASLRGASGLACPKVRFACQPDHRTLVPVNLVELVVIDGSWDTEGGYLGLGQRLQCYQSTQNFGKEGCHDLGQPALLPDLRLFLVQRTNVLWHLACPSPVASSSGWRSCHISSPKCCQCISINIKTIFTLKTNKHTLSEPSDPSYFSFEADLQRLLPRRSIPSLIL